MGIEKIEGSSSIVGIIPDNDIFPNLGVALVDAQEDLHVECESTNGSVAEDILAAYSIPYNGSYGVTPGNLDNLDIKRIDAMTALNLSLLDGAARAGSAFMEPIVNEDGEVEFKIIGSYSGSISDIYYELHSGSFREDVKAVMVAGCTPLSYAKVLEFKPIWGNSATIYHMEDVFANCRKKDFSKYATIVFNDPHLDSSFEDGIDNLYEIGTDNPYDTIAGYIKYIDPTKNATEKTNIQLSNVASIPIKISGEDGKGVSLGILQELKPYIENLEDPTCSIDFENDAIFANGIKIELPEDMVYENVRGVLKNKFIKVSAVYLIGIELDMCTYFPTKDSDCLAIPTTSNSLVRISTDKTTVSAKKLEEGKHYAVGYENVGEITNVAIVFAKDTRTGDPFPYGEAQECYMYPDCQYAMSNKINFTAEQTDLTLFPYNKYQGMIVKEVWAVIDVETPSISIFDPLGQALEIARGLQFLLAPLIMVKEPAPIAFCDGSPRLLDLVQSQQDNDPTTAQSFSDTEYEQALDIMQGNGFSVTFSFLSAHECINMARLLYNYANSDIVETVYTCGPNCDPQLGGAGYNGGVVNAIKYNYSDSGAYTISVTEGPYLVGNLTQWDGGPTEKAADNFSAVGVVTETGGDNLYFKVRIDGYGYRYAINMSDQIVRNGDLVNCIVHNNPIEQ